MKKGIIISLVLLFICCAFGGYYFYDKNKKEENKRQEKISLIKSHYNKYVKIDHEVNLYDDKENVIGSVKNVELELKDIEIDENTKYFYSDTIDAYVKYEDVVKIDSLTKEDNYWKNYIPFNKEVILIKGKKLYIDDNSFYQFNLKEIKFNPIIIDGEKYYFEYLGHLVYVNKSDIEKEIETSYSAEIASSIAVLNYHYIVNKDAGELKECVQSICITDTQYEEELKYLKDNGYYTATMKDTELFLTGKVNLPKKTVVITIDDGWYVARNIALLEKYEMHGTLFLIGNLAQPDAYKSDYLEIHSHGWNIHNIGECPGTLGGAILCKDKQYLLDDLKKSRDSLNNTTYFCYPFYEYNERAIEILKEAGFTMAFKGGRVKAKPGVNLFKVPRYSITNSDTLKDFISYIS